MWQDRRLWIALVLASAAAVVVSARYFQEAFPLVAVELEMDRRGALSSASSLAAEHGWPTESHRQAASFGQRDEELKRYVELEAGGPAAWTSLVEAGEHHPYQWRVRRYLEGEATEAEVRFTAAGSPWGFMLRLPEDEPGAALEAGTARSLAESAAAGWGVALDLYQPVESRQEARPGGRVDHWFVYERPDMGYGEARFRLRLGVAGDVPSEVTRFVEVPEAFKRRHSEMRSTNELIALVASLSSFLLYLGVGAGLGLVLLLRRRWVVWRQPLLWGGIVGGLMMAAQLNQLPLAWMEYDTAVGRGGYVTTQLLVAIAGGVGFALFVALVIMAGESLSRRAFPGHVQLWRTWSGDVARSGTGLGLTAGGYVFAGFFIAHVVLFYMFATRVLGWPVSTESVLHPDLLATPFPWLSAVAISLLAGFSEEAMFRAIPLAGAALIAARYGRRGLWIGAALVIQALIFAAAHANYAQQPPYARVVELFLPSIALGLVFLRFGFLPAVVAHFAYDMVWFSVPVFASSAPGSWLNQALLVALGLAPLGVVMVARWRGGATAAAPASAYNAAWRPPEAPAEGADEPAIRGGDAGAGRPVARPTAGGAALPAALTRWAPLVGVAAVAGWLAASSVIRPVSPPLDVGMAAAAETARAELESRGLVDPGAEPAWRILPRAHTSVHRTNPHRFVWSTAGEEAYRALLGEHLPAPHWDVRAVRFDGPVEDRAEEFLVEVDAVGAVHRVRHTLPEDRPGPALDEAAARALALAAARERWGHEASSLREVSAAASQRPERLDWTFTFEAPAAATLDEGETRVRVVVSGDQVTDAVALVHVPEAWERERRARETQGRIASIATALLIVGLLVTAVVVGIGRLARRRLPGVVTAVGAIGGTLVIAGGMANGFPEVMASFLTEQPYGTQLVSVALVFGFMALAGGALFGVLLGLAHAWSGEAVAARATPGWAGAARLGLPAGAALAAVLAAATVLAASGPPWADYEGAGTWVPALAAALRPLQRLFVVTLFGLLALGALDRLWVPGRPVARVMVGVALVLVVGSSIASDTLLAWALASVAAAGVLAAGVALLRAVGPAVMPAVAGALVLLGAVPTLLHGPYPGGRSGLVVGWLLVLPAALLWARMLARSPEPAPDAAPERVEVAA